MLHPLAELIDFRDDLETEIKSVSAPFKKALSDALGELPATLKRAKAFEDNVRADVAAEIVRETEARRARLLDGEECPPVDAPAGLSLTWRAGAEGPASVELVSLGLATVEPDEKAILRTLQAGGTVPGWAIVNRVTLVRRR